MLGQVSRSLPPPLLFSHSLTISLDPHTHRKSKFKLGVSAILSSERRRRRRKDGRFYLKRAALIFSNLLSEQCRLKCSSEEKKKKAPIGKIACQVSPVGAFRRPGCVQGLQTEGPSYSKRIIEFGVESELQKELQPVSLRFSSPMLGVPLDPERAREGEAYWPNCLRKESSMPTPPPFLSSPSKHHSIPLSGKHLTAH